MPENTLRTPPAHGLGAVAEREPAPTVIFESDWVIGRGRGTDSGPYTGRQLGKVTDSSSATCHLPFAAADKLPPFVTWLKKSRRITSWQNLEKVFVFRVTK